MFFDNTLTNEGDFLHLALFVDVELVKFEQEWKKGLGLKYEGRNKGH